MAEVICETGRIVEIGSSYVYRTLHYFSHLVLERKDGKVVRLEHLISDDFLVPSLRVGAEGTIAFVNRRAHLSKEFDNRPVRNGIVGFADASGYIPLKQPHLTRLPQVSLGIAAVGFLLFLFTRGSAFPFAWGLVCWAIILPFGALGLANINNNKKATSLHDQVVSKFEAMGLKSKASVVYN